MKKAANIISKIIDNKDFDVDEEFDEDEKIEQEKVKREEKIRIEKQYSEKIEQVFKIPIPKEKSELIILLSELLVQLKTNKWYSNKEICSKIKNQYSDTIFEKYKQCAYLLESIAPESQVDYYKKIIKKQTIKRFFQKNKSFFKYFGLFILFFIIALILLKYIIYLVIISAIIAIVFVVFKNKKNSNSLK